MNRLIVILVLLFIALSGCKDSNENVAKTVKSEALPTPSWIENAVLYEVNTRNFTPEGTFNAFKAHLPRLRTLGVDILWFMPINPISVEKRKATNDLLVAEIKDEEERKKYLGSPYAVADYKAVNPNLGTMDDFKSLIEEAHRKGMKVIIDWVPNHTGWDNKWITEHPEWYTKDDDGNIIDPIDYNTGESWGWTDVADLDYSNSEMRKEMISNMRYWIEDVGIDGFRVDVAHGIPDEFWDEMRESFLTLPKEVFMLAESEVPYHRNSGAFHATYGWSFHHLMNEIARGEKGVSDIKKWYNQDLKKFNKGFHIHFTSNHDENTWAGTVFERMGDAHQALAVLAATMPGMPLIYNGQENPLRKRIPFFVKDAIDWSNQEYVEFYQKLFNFKEECTAMKNSKGSEIEFISSDESVLAFRRKNNFSEVLVIINLSDEYQEYSLDIEYENYREIFSNALKDHKQGVQNEIGPWSYLVLDGTYMD